MLKSEKKRIVGVIAFVAFFAALATVRIFVLGSAMSRWGLVVATLIIAFEIRLFRAVVRVLREGKDIPGSFWYCSVILGQTLHKTRDIVILITNGFLRGKTTLAKRLEANISPM